MEFREPLLSGMKTKLLVVASLFAGYVWYAAAVEAGFEPVLLAGFSLIGFVSYGFLQGYMPLVNWCVYPVLAFLDIWFTPLGYGLGVVSIVVFALTQFRPPRRQ